MNQCKIISFICLFVLLLYSCKESPKDKKNRFQSVNSLEANELVALDNRLMEMRKYLMYKRISSLHQIVNNSDDGENDRSIVVSYSGADCSTCIGEAFEIIKNYMKKLRRG